MPDISKCQGYDCKQKNTCWRFTSKPSEAWQSYFVGRPLYKTDTDCDMYWDDSEWSDDYKIPKEQRSL